MDQSMNLQDLVPFAGAQTMLILVGLVASGKVHVISNRRTGNRLWALGSNTS